MHREHESPRTFELILSQFAVNGNILCEFNCGAVRQQRA